MVSFINELRNYQPIPRELIFDNSISDRARFLYCYMAAKPDDWEFYIGPMSKELGYSVETIRKFIKELVDAGWIVKEGQSRDGGRFSAVTYTLKSTKSTVTENFRDGKIPAHKENISIQKRDINNNPLPDTRAEDEFSEPTVDDVRAYCEEKGIKAVNPKKFVAHYKSVGWKIGGKPMDDWKSCVDRWNEEEKEKIAAKEKEKEERKKAGGGAGRRKESVFEQGVRALDELGGTNYHEQIYGDKTDGTGSR